jgi:hypothetical protein
MKKSMRKRAPSPPLGSGALREVSEEREERTKSAAPEAPRNKYSSGESSEEEEDTRDMEGNVYTKGGVEVRRGVLLRFFLFLFTSFHSVSLLAHFHGANSTASF